jgi:hypothetical protein
MPYFLVITLLSVYPVIGPSRTSPAHDIPQPSLP